MIESSERSNAARAVRFGARSRTAVRSAEAVREISLESKKRSLDRHRDIGHREIGVLEVVCIGTAAVAKSR